MSAINIQWLDQTFSSRTQAETVLRPYLEAGTITEHDYNLAVSFLPGRHRYWPVRLHPCCEELHVLTHPPLSGSLQRWRNSVDCGIWPVY